MKTKTIDGDEIDYNNLVKIDEVALPDKDVDFYEDTTNNCYFAKIISRRSDSSPFYRKINFDEIKKIKNRKVLFIG